MSTQQISIENADAKEKRRQLHNEQFELAQQRRAFAKRTLLSQEWMSLFAYSEDLFRATLKELNVFKSEWENNTEMYSEKDAALADYKSFYLDSLNSFGKALSEKDAESGISLTSFQSIDKFADSSFGDIQFSKQYRTMGWRIQRRAKLEAQLRNNMEDHICAIKELEGEEEILNQVKGDIPKPPRKSKRDDFDELEQIESDVIATMSKLILSDAKMRIKQENKVENAKRRIDNIKKRIGFIQKDIDEIILPLSQEEYHAATSQLLKVSYEIIPDLARFITNRHSDFEQYRQLEQHTDLTKPHEWYPRARLDQRKIIFHAGKTASSLLA
jgi:hypothetical protein